MVEKKRWEISDIDKKKFEEIVNMVIKGKYGDEILIDTKAICDKKKKMVWRIGIGNEDCFGFQSSIWGEGETFGEAIQSLFDEEYLRNIGFGDIGLPDIF